MRIGIEAQRLFRPHKHGMDVVALELIRALQRTDTQNEYFIFVKPDTDRKCLQSTDNVKIIEIPSTNYAVWEQVQLPRFARKYNLDVLHCTANTAPVFCKIPLVLTLHDVIFLEKTDKKSSASAYQRYGNMYRSWLVPHVTQKASQVVTVSQYEKGQIKNQLPLQEEKISVVYNGLSTYFQRKPTEAQVALVKQRYHLPQRFLLFLGNTDPRKNLKKVLKAFAELAEKQSDIELVITGLSEEVIESELTKQGKLPLRRRIRCIGYVPFYLLPIIYREAEAFLYPSLHEGFGLPILEAMSCGTPVVTSTSTAMPEVAGDAAYLVNPHDAKDILRGIEAALTHDALRSTKVSAGLKRVNQFSWDRSALQMQQIYQSIAS
ncbi:MAG: glycosyltransferase family 1 protein [Spirosomataceae bacterium]